MDLRILDKLTEQDFKDMIFTLCNYNQSQMLDIEALSCRDFNILYLRNLYPKLSEEKLNDVPEARCPRCTGHIIDFDKCPHCGHNIMISPAYNDIVSRKIKIRDGNNRKPKETAFLMKHEIGHKSITPGNFLTNIYWVSMVCGELEYRWALKKRTPWKGWGKTQEFHMSGVLSEGERGAFQARVSQSRMLSEVDDEGKSILERKRPYGELFRFLNIIYDNLLNTLEMNNKDMKYDVETNDYFNDMAWEFYYYGENKKPKDFFVKKQKKVKDLFEIHVRLMCALAHSNKGESNASDLLKVEDEEETKHLEHLYGILCALNFDQRLQINFRDFINEYFDDWAWFVIERELTPVYTPLCSIVYEDLKPMVDKETFISCMKKLGMKDADINRTMKNISKYVGWF